MFFKKETTDKNYHEDPPGAQNLWGKGKGTFRGYFPCYSYFPRMILMINTVTTQIITGRMIFAPFLMAKPAPR